MGQAPSGRQPTLIFALKYIPMPKKIRWGVLGVAKIATAKVIPAMQRCEFAEITAIASRDPAKAETAAHQLGIPKAYGSYEALIADPAIDAIYNPLPNHLHVPWSIRAAEAGKHVLCEKPISLDVEEAEQLIAARDRTGVTMGEAFMVNVHPQWLRTRDIIHSGEIGALRAMNCVFGYNNRDPHNIRNLPEAGGGALMDIGCYPIHIARWIFGEEPHRVSALIERDLAFGTDRLVSALLDFPSSQATFTCGTQMGAYQRIIFFGEFGAASKSKFPSTRHRIKRPTSLSKRCRGLGPKRSRSVINTPFRATLSRKPSWERARSLYPSKTPSVTWP